MKQFKQYCKSFICDDSGMELLQLAIVVVITVGLIGVVTALQKIIAGRITDASKQVESWDPTKNPTGGDAGGAGN